MTDTKDDYYARGFPPQIFVEAWGGRWSRHADGTQEMEYVRADRIEELESKLAKAVEALQTLKDWPEYRLLSSQEYACNTLAELEGEEDE
jgi:hypothetical protein